MDTRERVERQYGLPMLFRGKDRSLSLSEWNAYHKRQRWHQAHNPGYEEKWRRPRPEIAEKVWAILEAHGLHLDGLRPAVYKRITVPEQTEVDLTIKQAMVIALDAFVEAGRIKVHRNKSAMVVILNRVFDGLALGWSDHFRRVAAAGHADRARDMRPDTVKAARRDLLRNGIDLASIWAVVAGEWSQEGGENPLYWTRLAQVKQGRKVTLKPGRALADFERCILEDGQYERDGVGWAILRANELPGRMRVTDQRSCMEIPYNVIESAARAKQVMRVLERARLTFNVRAFREDYEAATEDVKAQFGAAYEQSASMPETVVIKTRIRREINRRYQALDLWPTAVSGKLDRPERVAYPARPDVVSASGLSREIGNREGTLVADSSMRGRWFSLVTASEEAENVLEYPLNLLGLDVSASQTTILAIFLGLAELEDIAGKESFNSYLARCAWDRRMEFLHIPGTAADYTGPTDERLVLLVKQLWMRVLYGAPTAWTTLGQWKTPEKVGPGWKRTPERRVIPHAAEMFLESIPQYQEIAQFLKACQHIASRVDRYRGFEFTDPFDQVHVRWNPVERIDTYIKSEGVQILVSVPGKTKTTRHRDDDQPPGTEGRKTARSKAHGSGGGDEYPIDRKELRSMIAPCLTHTLDSAFAGQVVEQLDQLGAKDTVIIHDAFFTNGDLAAALDAATPQWFKSLGSVYTDLLKYLSPDDIFRPMLETAQAKWKARLARNAWPTFRMKSDEPITDWSLIPHS